MFRLGEILHGYFDLGANGKKNKFSIVLYADDNACIITTFTTSQPRSSVLNPDHGKNPKEGDPMSYVFKAGVEIGVDPNTGLPFSFNKDTSVVPDYGIYNSSIEAFNSSVNNLTIVCQLDDNEYESLIYTLYRCKSTKKKYKEIFEKILTNIIA